MTISTSRDRMRTLNEDADIFSIENTKNRRLHFMAESAFARVSRPEKVEQPTTTLWKREDGLCLLYPGRAHVFYGKAESRKSWAALAATVECIRELHRPVFYIDYEDSELDFWPRLDQLGLTVAEQESIFRAVPEAPYSDKDIDGLITEIEAENYGLVVVNGVTAALATQGLLSTSDTDIANFYRKLPVRMAHTKVNPTVIIVDHEGNSESKRAAGSHYKRGGVEAEYHFATVSDKTRITLRKDRPNHVREGLVSKAKYPAVADFRLISREEGLLSWELRAPSGGAEEPDSTAPRLRNSAKDQGILAALKAGTPWAQIQKELKCGSSTIAKVRDKYADELAA
ncbi:MAG: AAA family ATPase [Actinomycetota bacterium]|nr:AAA family ATPase [Actinomycetota bacterium]MDQ6947293.1 AAA family ATPase [Actinomycetota bacterium]